MLSRWTHPGIFVTSAVPGAGKTVVAGAIAHSLKGQCGRVGVLKPVDPHCVHRREGLVSEDAEILAHRGDVRFPLDAICPLRSRQTLPAFLTGALLDWKLVQQSLDLMRVAVDVLVVEGTGGIMTPLDAKSTNLDLARWLELPVVVAVRPGEDAMNQILSCVQIIRGAQLTIAGVVVNAYDPEKASAADEKMLSAIERWTKARLLAVLPEETAQDSAGLLIGQGIAEAAGKVDWASLAGIAPADG